MVPTFLLILKLVRMFYRIPEGFSGNDIPVFPSSSMLINKYTNERFHSHSQQFTVYHYHNQQLTFNVEHVHTCVDAAAGNG